MRMHAFYDFSQGEELVDQALAGYDLGGERTVVAATEREHG